MENEEEFIPPPPVSELMEQEITNIPNFSLNENIIEGKEMEDEIPVPPQFPSEDTINADEDTVSDDIPAPPQDWISTEGKPSTYSTTITIESLRAKIQQEMEENKKETENEPLSAPVTAKPVNLAGVHDMAEGWIGLFTPEINKIIERLNDLQKTQEMFIGAVQIESERYNFISSNIQPAISQLSLIPQYHGKLMQTKKDMVILRQRLEKCKQRAEKLKNRKQQDEKNRALEKQRQLEKDQMLLAQPAATLQTNTNTASKDKIKKSSSKS